MTPLSTAQSAARECRSRFRARYAETDQMGVIYHAHYLVWCEIGRTDFIRELGVTYAELERSGHFLAVSDARIRYAGSARYDDPILVVTRLAVAQSRAVTFEYEIFREDTVPVRLATASTRLVALDAAGAIRKLPDSIIELFQNAL